MNRYAHAELLSPTLGVPNIYQPSISRTNRLSAWVSVKASCLRWPVPILRLLVDRLGLGDL
jgi:hypothetical protein